MDKKEYLKHYKKYHYSKTRKVISFPLLLDDYEVLADRANALNIKPTRLSKEIVLNFIENNPSAFMTPQQEAMINNYLRVSRGIANNINQIAHNTNLKTWIDTDILIGSLKQYEDEFKAMIARL